MAQVIITLKLMPKGVDVNLEEIETKAKKLIVQFAGEGEMIVEQQPIAFGLKALQIIFVMDESLGSTEELEKSISEFDEVGSVEITDVRRAIG